MHIYSARQNDNLIAGKDNADLSSLAYPNPWNYIFRKKLEVFHNECVIFVCVQMLAVKSYLDENKII